MQPPPFRVLLEPLAQPRPLAQQRLVRDLERILAHSHETAVGETPSPHVAASSSVSSSSSASGARRRTASSPSTLASRRRILRAVSCWAGVNPLYASSAIRATAPRTPPLSRYASSRSVRPSRCCQSSTSAVESSGSPPGSSTTSATRASTSAGSTRRPARRDGSYDRAPQVLRFHRADQDVVLGELARERGEGCKAPVEVGPDGDDNRFVRSETSERVEEHHALGLVAAEREHLLELIDDEQEPRARSVAPRLSQLVERMLSRSNDDLHPLLRAGERATREGRREPCSHDRRLAASRRPYHAEQRRSRQARDELCDELLSPEERVGIRDVEARQALEGTDSLGGRDVGLDSVREPAGGRRRCS